jgi:hypothetical protein
VLQDAVPQMGTAGRAPEPRARVHHIRAVRLAGVGRFSGLDGIVAPDNLAQYADTSLSLGHLGELFRDTCCACGAGDLAHVLQDVSAIQVSKWRGLTALAVIRTSLM